MGVTIQYLQRADGSVEPQKIHTVVISTQHAEPLKATRCKEVAGYTGPDATAPSMEDMNKLIVEEVVKKTLAEITLKSGESALTLFGDFTHLHINPSGKFIIGGSQVGRSSLTHTAAGEPMEEVLSLARTRRRSTGQLLTFAGRWPSRWSRVVSASAPWCSCPTRLASRSLCRFSWRPMGQSREDLVRMTLPTSSRLHSIAGQEPSRNRSLFASPSTRRQQPTATSVARHTQRTASSSSSGRTRRICPNLRL